MGNNIPTEHNLCKVEANEQFWRVERQFWLFRESHENERDASNSSISTLYEMEKIVIFILSTRYCLKVFWSHRALILYVLTNNKFSQSELWQLNNETTMKFRRKMKLQRFQLMRIVCARTLRSATAERNSSHTHTWIDWFTSVENKVRNLNESFFFFLSGEYARANWGIIKRILLKILDLF